MNSKKIKVYFTGKKLRQRRKETVLHPPKGIKFITQIPIKEMLYDHEVPSKDKIKGKTLLKKLVRFINLPNIRFIPKEQLKGIDLVYTPGQLIINKVPWVVEIDNIGCLGYYSFKTIK